MGRELNLEERAYVCACCDLNKKLGPTKLRVMVHRRFRHWFSKGTIWNCMRRKTFKTNKRKGKVGRHRKTTKAEDNALVRLLKPLQKKWHKKKGECNARVIKAHWNTVRKDFPKSLVSRRLREKGKPWRSVVHKLPLSKQDRKDALAFAKKYNRKSYEWFMKRVLYIDNKKWPIYNTLDSKEYATMQSVRGMYRTAKDGVELALPGKKHRKGTGYKSLNIISGFGNGKCHFAIEVCKPDAEGDTRNWCADEYVKVVRYHIRKAFRDDPELKFLWRDQDPNGFNTKKGTKAERSAGLNVVQMPHRRPGLNPLDFTFHDAVERRVKETAPADDTYESPAGYRVRVRSCYFDLSEESVRKGCRDLKTRRLPGVILAKGGHFAPKYGSD